MLGQLDPLSPPTALSTQTSLHQLLGQLGPPSPPTAWSTRTNLPTNCLVNLDLSPRQLLSQLLSPAPPLSPPRLLYINRCIIDMCKKCAVILFLVNVAHDIDRWGSEYFTLNPLHSTDSYWRLFLPYLVPLFYSCSLFSEQHKKMGIRTIVTTWPGQYETPCDYIPGDFCSLFSHCFVPYILVSKQENAQEKRRKTESEKWTYTRWVVHKEINKNIFWLNSFWKAIIKMTNILSSNNQT